MTNAMSGLATGAKGNDHEQTVHTPDVILDVCREVFGGTIAMDPCASFGNEFAVENLYGPGHAARSFSLTSDRDGLKEVWTDGTYWNPPYKYLKAWMAHARKQPIEHIGLFPVRTNRQWWCDYMLTEVDRIAYLKPLKFKGYTQAFPAPLVLVYRGPNGDAFEGAVRGRNLACTVAGPL
jgi:hypothetical protein